MMLWTQNAWAQGDNRAAAYRCMNGHVLDPAMTRECPKCGVHDTQIVEQAREAAACVCNACGARFT
jgi:predicted nucleic acid-binding Zn ribbon protein